MTPIHRLPALVSALLCLGLSAQITVDPTAPLTVCGDLDLPVAFSTTDIFNAGNVFTVELSDFTGSFASPTVIGSASGTGAGSIPCTFPIGIYGGGQAIRVMASDPPQLGETYVLPIVTMIPPNAGTNASFAVCSNEPPFSMWALLGGSPEPGGAWIGPDGNFQSGVFLPAFDIPGCHTYSVAGMPPCPNATSVLCIAVSQAVELGTDFSIDLCGNTPIDMQTSLSPGGTWTYMGASHSNIFTPGVDTPGPYVYTVPGISPCPDASITAIMNVAVPPNAGSNASVNWCLSFGQMDLFAQLGGAPDLGGLWTDDDATGALNASNFDPAGVPTGTYSFTYSVPGTGQCLDESATVIVNLSAACLAQPQVD